MLGPFGSEEIGEWSLGGGSKIKETTARRCNRSTVREGGYWQREVGGVYICGVNFET